MPERSRPTGEQLLAKLQTEQRARLRIYIGAAPGVGKTYAMVEDAHTFRREGVDVVIGFVETHGRADTEARVADLETVPRRRIDYRGVTLEEMDLDAILARKPALCVVDELAHTNVAGSRHEKRYQDVLDLLDAGIGVMTAVNIQHLETLNDAVTRVTGVRVRETVPDTFLDRADEIVNVDVTVEELHSRLRQGKVYKPEKVEQALANFFRETNISTLRELALRAVADEIGDRAASRRQREGLEPALIPERVMVCLSSSADAPRVLRTGARIAGRLGARWYAVYVETPREAPGHIKPQDRDALQRNIALAEELGATVVRVRADRPADGLIAFAKREGITHVDLRSERADAMGDPHEGVDPQPLSRRSPRCHDSGRPVGRAGRVRDLTFLWTLYAFLTRAWSIVKALVAHAYRHVISRLRPSAWPAQSDHGGLSGA